MQINHNSRNGTNIRLIHLQNKTIIPKDNQKNILETERHRELAYQTFVEERISGGDNLWNKLTKVKVLKWTAAAKPLKTNDAKQNIAIQESRTVMPRLLVITRSFRDIDLREVISKHELSTIDRLLMIPDGMLQPCSDKSQLIYKLESITSICDDLDESSPDAVAPNYDKTCGCKCTGCI